MTTFDERENAYEAKFAHDEELRFKATARRDKYFGLWAAERLGLTGAEAEDYAKEVMRADFRRPGDTAIIEKVLGDFRAKGIATDELSLKRKLIEFMGQTLAEIEGKK